MNVKNLTDVLNELKKELAVSTTKKPFIKSECRYCECGKADFCIVFIGDILIAECLPQPVFDDNIDYLVTITVDCLCLGGFRYVKCVFFDTYLGEETLRESFKRNFLPTAFSSD